MKDTWIEGIGSVYRYGLLYPNDPSIVLDASTPYFGCFTHNNITYIDGSNCSGTCPCTNWLVAIEKLEKEENNIRLFPNPVLNSLTVELQDDHSDYTYLELLSYDAKLIKRIEINTEKIELDLKPLNNGIYLLKFSGNEKTVLRKIIKK